MGFGTIGHLARQAGIGGDTLKVIDELETHPLAAAGTLAREAGRGFSGIGKAMGLGGHRPHPYPSLPANLGKTVSPNLAALMGAMESTGRTVEGLQPWHVSGYYLVPAGTVIANNADIADMFAAAQTKLFSTDDTFPWTFLCKRFRCATVTEPIDPGTEDGVWARQLSLRFAVATEVGRISTDALGVDRVIEGPAVGAAYGGVAAQIFPNPGVPFPVIFEKNGTYQMFLHTDFGITTTKNFAFSYQMDGWVVQNTAALGEEAIVASLGNLMG